MTKFNLDKLREIAEPRKMTRARVSALKAFPGQQFIHDRCVFRFGYEQAEKDTIAEVEKWLKANFHHRNCWNADEFCISLRTYFGINNGKD